jgi:hypothetical protein
MLLNRSRLFTYLTGTLYEVLGFLLFFLPEQLAPLFAFIAYLAVGILLIFFFRNLGTGATA